MKIAICDDELLFLEKLKAKIYDYSNKHNWESIVDAYSSGTALIASNIKYDLIILDYQMDEINGLETARMLRDGINKLACIIFLTGFPHIAISAYSVDTYRFVLKNTLYEGLYSALDDFRNTQTIDYDICIKSNNEFISINTNEIAFMEVQNKDSFIHTSNNKTIITKTPLKKLYSQVPHSHFFRIHKSYVVNLKYIKKRVNSLLFIKASDYKLPISRKYLSKFKEVYYNFIKDH